MQLALQSLNLSDGVMIHADAANQFATHAEAEQMLNLLNEHDLVLKQCLDFVAKSYERFEEKSDFGVTVIGAQALNDARQFMGNFGNVQSGVPRIKISNMTAKHRARQTAGNMDGPTLEALFNRK